MFSATAPLKNRSVLSCPSRRKETESGSEELNDFHSLMCDRCFELFLSSNCSSTPCVTDTILASLYHGPEQHYLGEGADSECVFVIVNLI